MTDAFTFRRVGKFVDQFRAATGQLPTLRDFEAQGFAKALVERAVREKVLVERYVTLTNGAVVKGYKRSSR